MPFVVYSLLRLALFGACWFALVWAGLNPFVAVVAAALTAWGLSYVALRGPRDAAARWIAEKDAARKAAVARPGADAAAEDALLDAAGDEPTPPQSASPSPSSTP